MKLRKLLLLMGVSVLMFTGCSQAQTEVTHPVEQVSVQASEEEVVEETTEEVVEVTSEPTEVAETPKRADYTEEDLINVLREMEQAGGMEYDSHFTVSVDDGSGSPKNLVTVETDYHAETGLAGWYMSGLMDMYAYGVETKTPVEYYVDTESNIEYVQIPETKEWVYQQRVDPSENATLAFATENFDYLKLGKEDSMGRPVLIGEANATHLFTTSAPSLEFDAGEIGINSDDLVAKVMFHFNRETLALEQAEVVCDECKTDKIRMFNWTFQVKYVAINDGTTFSIPADVVSGATHVSSIN